MGLKIRLGIVIAILATSGGTANAAWRPDKNGPHPTHKPSANPNCGLGGEAVLGLAALSRLRRPRNARHSDAAE